MESDTKQYPYKEKLRKKGLNVRADKGGKILPTTHYACCLLCKLAFLEAIASLVVTFSLSQAVSHSVTFLRSCYFLVIHISVTCHPLPSYTILYHPINYPPSYPSYTILSILHHSFYPIHPTPSYPFFTFLSIHYHPKPSYLPPYLPFYPISS